MRDGLLRVGNDYPSAKKQRFAGHSLAMYLRNGLRRELSDALGELSAGLLTAGSPGAGNWATVPWGAVFDPMVTESAERGYYVVYLFAAHAPEIHLSLNQGATAVMHEFGRQGVQVLRDRAAVMRARLKDFLTFFDAVSIDLGSSKSLPIGYEAGHALGRTYRISDLPNEETLRSDLQMLTRAYLALTFRGGLEAVPEATLGEGDGSDSPVGPGATLTEERQYRMHRRIERNPKAAKEAKAHHGLACQACGLVFASRYGDLGAGFIEAHHLRPLSLLEEGLPVNYDVETDFAVLCSNCHRMIHRSSNPADIVAFRRHIK